MNQNVVENKRTWQGLNYFHLVKLSDTGNILNNFVNITPPVEISTTKILQPLHSQAIKNSLLDPTITSTITPVLKFTQN